MSAPTIYRSDDPGAPDTTNDVKNGVYEILKACLVDGYSGKPGAGWSVVFDAWATDGVCTFTNSGQSGVLGLSYNSNGTVGPIIFTASAMIDAVTGINVRSGSDVADIANLKNSADANSGNCSLFGFTSQSQCDYWCVIANEHFCCMWLSPYSDSLFSTTHDNSNYYKIQNVFFGSVESLSGLGSVSTPSSGNFIFQGAGRKNQNVYWALDGNSQGIAITGQNGGMISELAYAYVYPYCLGEASLGSDPDAHRRIDLVPLAIYVAVANTSMSNANQTCVVPMLFSGVGMSKSDVYEVMSAQGRVSLTDVIDIGGKSYLWAPLNYGEAVFISLDASDWA
jgi:hypothetical protein